MKGIKFVEDIGMLYPNEKSTRRYRYFLAECFCGNKFKIREHLFKNDSVKSCGCYKSKRTKEVSTTHGKSGHKLYKIFAGMKQRCYNSNSDDYIYYGAKGVRIDQSWLSDFNSFYDWAINNGYKNNLTIDRIDCNGNYEPSNCRWVNMSVQNGNRLSYGKTGVCGYKGVRKSKTKDKFEAQISVNNKRIFLGTFDTALDAAKAYNKYVLENNLDRIINLERI